ncbi:SusC/RagA family TonB-linked outer membrane protein [Proteiniphilum saccharofermentans]|nr:TonB-dependent receptor [Proteiniphilum saccharofermentans]
MKRWLSLLIWTISVCASAQNVTVRGTVSDTSGEALIGVTVLVQGSSEGTITDVNGSYIINVSPDAFLQFSYVGYISQSIEVGNLREINVVLEEDLQTLDEVVVVGYGVMKRRDLTGAVSSVKAADIEKVASSNAMQALQAQVPGLDITQNDGQAGSALSMTVRGTRSISASNSPLVLVDGVEYGSTIDINASDIVSIDVLKDAASTAIYGTKGANGVIIITTKRGEKGKTRVNFNSYLSSNIATSYAKPLFGVKEVQAWVDKENYAKDLASGNWGTSNLQPTDLDAMNQIPDNLPDGQQFTTGDIYASGNYVDWLDHILQGGLTQNYDISVSGGSEKTNFSLSLGMMNEQGLLKGDEMTRYNGKITLDHAINKYVKVGANIMYALRSQDSRNSSVFGQALKMTSVSRAYNEDGSLVYTPNALYKAHVSPLADDVEGVWSKNNQSTRFFGNVYGEVSPVKGLLFRTMINLSRRNGRVGNYNDYMSVANYQSPKTTMSLEYSMNTSYVWDNTLTYNTKIDMHEITAMVGTSAQQSISEGMSASGQAGIEHYYASSFYDISKVGMVTPSSSYTKTSQLSFFGRAVYTYADKYTLMATMRRDGNSTLSAGNNKWGNFPSVGANWRINEEHFMEGTKDWMSNLKIRATWGISGNPAVDAYGTLPNLSSQALYYYYGGSDSKAGYLPSKMGNPNLKWETTKASNFGLDFGFLKNRISGSVDYYITHTDDLIYLKTAPASSVFPSVMSNVGSTKGSGLEIAINTTPVLTKNFTWNANFSYSTSTDEVVYLTDGLNRNIVGTGGQIVGEPVNIFYNYKAEGTWNVGEWEEYQTAWEARHPGESMEYMNGYGTPGTIKVADLDDNGKIDDNDKIVYNRSPKHIFGMNNTVTYKNLSLSVQLYARLGGYMSYGLNGQMYFEPQWQNWGDLDYWIPDGKSHRFPNPGATTDPYKSVNTTYASALLYEKADFFKIKDITLTYNLPKTWISNLHIDNVRIYGQLKNYLTWSKVGDGYDSERGGSTSFPLAKQAVIGLNIQF